MDDKLTFEDFFATIGILAVALMVYAWYKKRKAQEWNGICAVSVSSDDSDEVLPMIHGLYAPTNALDGYMVTYDTSEGNTIGVVTMDILNNQSQPAN